MQGSADRPLHPRLRGGRLWHAHVRRKADPDVRSTLAKEDERLAAEIVRVHKKNVRVQKKNFGVYGAKQVWLQLNREGFKVRRDRVARLMARLGLEEVVRGKEVRTTTPDKPLARSILSAGSSMPRRRT